MDRFKSGFKKPSTDHVDKKNKRVVAMVKNRKDTRGRSFATRRNVPEAEPEDFVENLDQILTVHNENKLPETGETDLSNKNYMKVRLQKWKEEKQKQKLEKEKLQRHARPPFKVGIVRHDDSAMTAGSNVTSVVPKNVPKTLPVTKPFDFSVFKASVFRPMPQNTRAAAATSVVPYGGTKNGPASAKTQVAQISSTKKNQPNVQIRSLRSRNIPLMKTPTPASKSATPLPHKKMGIVTPHITVANSRSYNRLTPFKFGQISSNVAPKTPRSTKKENKKETAVKEPVEIKSLPPVKTPSSKAAPRISRNKASAQKPEKSEPSQPIKEALPTSVGRKSRSKVAAAVAATTQQIDKSSLPEALVVEKPDEANMEKDHDCPYFRSILSTTITELEQQCQHWEHEQESGGNQVTEVAREQLLLATGMARLLIREKFAQFRGLIENCEANSTETKTTCSDLQGFWDMIYLQVLDINDKFKELEYMKKNNWAPLETRMRNKVVQKKKITSKPKPAPPKGRSKFKAFLAAAKKPKEGSADEEIASEASVPITSLAVGRRSLMRMSACTHAHQRKMSIDSPRASAILSASRIAKVAGKKSFTLDDSFSSANILLDGEKSQGASFYNTPQRKSLRSKLAVIPDDDLPKATLATPLRSILKKTDAASILKKAVLFNAPLQEQTKEEENVLESPKPSIIHTYGSRSRHTLSVSPVKDKFDALILSPSYNKNKVSPLKTKPIVDQLETLVPLNPFADIDIAFRGYDENNSSRKRTPTPYVVNNGGVEYDDEIPAPKKLFKPPTPYVARKGRRSGRIEIPKGVEDVDGNISGVLEPIVPSSLTPVITPEAKGRKHRYSPYGGRKASLQAPNTPDLISWNTPEAKGVRKSVRIKKSVTNETT